MGSGREWDGWKGEHFSVEILYAYAGIAQQILIEDDEQYLLVDCGDGTLRDLRDRDFDMTRLAGILITHGHFDHVGGLHALLGSLRMIVRCDPLRIIAPAGCHQLSQIVRGFLNCYSDSLPFEIERIAATPHETIELDTFSIEPFPVVHCGSLVGGEILDQIPAMGYRITGGGETVAVTGDTGMCEEVKDLVRDADLALIEATFSDDQEVAAEVLEKVHLNESLANELGRSAKESRLIHRIRRR